MDFRTSPHFIDFFGFFVRGIFAGGLFFTMTSDNILVTAISLCAHGDSLSPQALEIDNEHLKNACLSNRARKHALYEQASLYYAIYCSPSAKDAPICEECEVPLVGKYQKQILCPRCCACVQVYRWKHPGIEADQRTRAFENRKRMSTYWKSAQLKINEFVSI